MCYEWQKNLLDPIMAVDEDGLWVHQKFGYAIPRRNGGYLHKGNMGSMLWF